MAGQFIVRAPEHFGTAVRHCTFKPFLPGIPGSEPYLAQAWKIADGLMRSTKVYVGASEYGALMQELIHEGGGAVPSGPRPASLKFGGNPCAHFINAGTDHAESVARLNRETEGAIDFKPRLEKLRHA